MLSVTDINVSLTPNIKGKESDIEIRFTPRNEDIKRSHRFQLILTDCYTGFDIPKLGARRSARVDVEVVSPLVFEPLSTFSLIFEHLNAHFRRSSF